jgi:hypothetical protein
MSFAAAKKFIWKALYSKAKQAFFEALRRDCIPIVLSQEVFKMSQRYRFLRRKVFLLGKGYSDGDGFHWFSSIPEYSHRLGEHSFAEQTQRMPT